MNVSAWSIRNPIPAVMLFVLLTLAGLMGFRAMKVQNFPDIDLPTVSVTASLPGTAPAQLETEVARKIENAVAPRCRASSTSTARSPTARSVTTIEFRLEKPIQEAVDDVRDAVGRIRGDLPADLKDPQIARLNLSGAPILTYTVASSRMDDEALSWFVDNDITKALLSVNGVGSVAGWAASRVRCRWRWTRRACWRWAPPRRMCRASCARCSRTPPAAAATWAAPSRRCAPSPRCSRPRSWGSWRSRCPTAVRVRLDQVATVTDTVAERRSAALLNGAPVVGFEITRSRGASEVEVDAAVTRVLATLRTAHPDLRIDQAFNMVDPVVDNYDGSMVLLYEGALLAVLVVWFFLRDWRATFVAAVALPLSVVPAFIGMWWLGFSVNVVTLLSLSLVVGILVDDAIVEIENIMRHLRMGKSPYQAAMEAADEIGLAVIATTFTLIAVFLPTAFMSGIAGKFFKQFGWTAALAVFASLVVARVLTPMMAAYLLKPIAADKRHVPDGRIMRGYLASVAWCLKHRILTALAAGAFFVGSIMLVPLLPTGFIPPDDLRPDPGQHRAAAGQHLRRHPRRGRAGARAGQRQPACATRLHRGGRRHGGRGPVCRRWRQRGAQGHADHQPDAAQPTARACASRPSKANCARPCSSCPARG
jgi:multidrug efflux pump subunit AcrB